MLLEKSRQVFKDFHDGIEAEGGLRGCRALAAAVGIKSDISRQHGAKRLHIAAARGGEKRLGLAYLAAIGPHPANEGLLHHILGVEQGASRQASRFDAPSQVFMSSGAATMGQVWQSLGFLVWVTPS
jgi:hypothetical protein